MATHMCAMHSTSERRALVGVIIHFAYLTCSTIESLTNKRVPYIQLDAKHYYIALQSRLPYLDGHLTSFLLERLIDYDMGSLSPVALKWVLWVRRITFYPSHCPLWIFRSLSYLMNKSLRGRDERYGFEIRTHNSRLIWLTFELLGRFTPNLVSKCKILFPVTCVWSNQIGRYLQSYAHLKFPLYNGAFVYRPI